MKETFRPIHLLRSLFGSSRSKISPHFQLSDSVPSKCNAGRTALILPMLL